MTGVATDPSARRGARLSVRSPLAATRGAVAHAPPARCGSANRSDRARPLTARRTRGEQVVPATSPEVSAVSRVPSTFSGRAVPPGGSKPQAIPLRRSRYARRRRHPSSQPRNTSRSPLRFFAPRVSVIRRRTLNRSTPPARVIRRRIPSHGRRSGPTHQAVIAAWPNRAFSTRPATPMGFARALRSLAPRSRVIRGLCPARRRTHLPFPPSASPRRGRPPAGPGPLSAGR